MTLPQFLDIEASSLGINSYPIEIAWSDNKGNIESHLINPYWVEEWTDWDYNAQQVHGLSRKLCREEGINPDWLCKHMDQSIIPGDVIYADGVPFDTHWIDVLYEVGSTRGYSKFKVVHSDTVMLPLLKNCEPDDKKRWQLYENLKLEARKMIGSRHRARPDVQYLIELWKLCCSKSNNT